MIAKDLAKVPINKLNFSVVDVETTGMNATYNRVMDIGIVSVKEGKIVDEWEALIDPQQEVPYWITRYTKLDTSSVRGSPIFAAYAKVIFSKLNETIFVGHNVGFDYSFVYSELKRNDMELSLPKLCTVLLGRKLLPKLSNAHLDAISDYYGIKISARHRALPDAQATAQILLNFIQIAQDKYGAKTYFDLEKLQQLKIDKELARAEIPLFDNSGY